jgi:phosphocarrier protein
VSKIIEKEIVIKNKLGIHARPAALLVQLANKFKSEICVCKDSEVVNAKSIIGIMTLAANYGSRLKIKAEGPDAEDAIKALVQLCNDKFGEK